MARLVFSIIASVFIFSNQSHALSQEDAFTGGDSFFGYSVSFFSIAGTTAKQLDTDNASIGSYNYFGLNWKLPSERKFALRLPFNYDTDGENKYGDQVSAQAKLSDIHVALVFYDLGYIGDIDFSGALKFYLPTSQVSQEMRTIAKIRFEMFAEYVPHRNWIFQYRFKPDLYWQGQKAYFNTSIPQFPDGNFVTDPRQTTKRASLEHGVQAAYVINQYFSPTLSAGFDEDWYYSSEKEQLPGGHETYGVLAMGLDFDIPSIKLGFWFQMTNKFALETRRGQGVAPFRPENLEYSVMTNALLF